MLIKSWWQDWVELRIPKKYCFPENFWNLNYGSYCSSGAQMAELAQFCRVTWQQQHQRSVRALSRDRILLRWEYCQVAWERILVRILPSDLRENFGENCWNLWRKWLQGEEREFTESSWHEREEWLDISRGGERFGESKRINLKFGAAKCIQQATGCMQECWQHAKCMFTEYFSGGQGRNVDRLLPIITENFSAMQVSEEKNLFNQQRQRQGKYCTAVVVKLLPWI